MAANHQDLRSVAVFFIAEKDINAFLVLLCEFRRIQALQHAIVELQFEPALKTNARCSCQSLVGLGIRLIGLRHRLGKLLL